MHYVYCGGQIDFHTIVKWMEAHNCLEGGKIWVRFVVKVFKCETVHEKLIIYRFFNCFKFEISFLLKLIKIKKKKFICNNET